ncbi:MAG TPA: PorP/SprF family type IX secretion system membrane protein [Flavobacteriales bacterium]|nr:PorP/SprF family type IX secretion system membrane protein [Flavobacteriales bacterium]
MTGKNKYVVLLTTILLIVFGQNARAQDPNFSQFYNNPIYYNPSMTAIGHGLAWRANARNLWGPVPGKFNTYSASVDAEALNKTGLGLIAYSDVAGEGMLRTQGAYIHYSYRPLETKRIIVQAGLSGGFIHKSIDWSQLNFSDQYDEVFGNVKPTAFVAPGYNNVMYPDFATGATVRFNAGKAESRDKKMTTTVGLSFHHLTRPKDAFISDGQRLPVKWLLHANTGILLNGLVYAPGFIFERQNKFQTFTIGANVMKSPVFAGLWFRNRSFNLGLKSYDSFIFNLGLNTLFNKTTRMRVTYGYDFTISRLKTSAMGTHELSIVFEFDDKVLFQSVKDKRRQKSKNKFKECVNF